MTYLETQQNEAQVAKEEARRLRTKMKTYERYLCGYMTPVNMKCLSRGTLLITILTILQV